MKIIRNYAWVLLLFACLMVAGACAFDNDMNVNDDSEEVNVLGPVTTPMVTEYMGRSYSHAYTIVDTLQTWVYDREGQVADQAEGLWGQDGDYIGNVAAYVDNGDGTVTDLNTGLMWQAVSSQVCMTYEEAVYYVDNLTLAGYDDWVLPSVKSIVSLNNYAVTEPGQLMIDEDYFSLWHNDSGSVYWTDTAYQLGMEEASMAEVYTMDFNGGLLDVQKTLSSDAYAYVLAVRTIDQDHSYGDNFFVSNGDGTVTDLSTGLVWQGVSDGIVRDWSEALAYAEALSLGGYDDWRLPNIKELQSIVAYYKRVSPFIEEQYFTLSDPSGGYYSSTTMPGDTGAAYGVVFGLSTDSKALENVNEPGSIVVLGKNMSEEEDELGSYHMMPTYVLCVRDDTKLEEVASIVK